MGIMVAIEVDYEDLQLLKHHLRETQRESDEVAAESPEDYSEGFGSLALGTTHIEMSARIVGILEPRNAPHYRQRYAIQKIDPSE